MRLHATLSHALLLCTAGAAAAQADGGGATLGPFVGHLAPTAAHVWMRAPTHGAWTLRLTANGVTRTAIANASNDRCVVWQLDGLEPGRAYRYEVLDRDGDRLTDGGDGEFRTLRAPEADGLTRLAFGSCARIDATTAATFRAVARDEVDAVVLLGDTPYIDSTQLQRQRARYAAFAAAPAWTGLLRGTAWYGTWDDHDFGRNDTDGRLPGKSDARRAFVEYHANPSYGDGEHGIYTKFRNGPVEVFLLDTRYFAATEPSPFRAHHASLLGAAQWSWLRSGLEASTAPIKLLACGMIWNAATRPNKLDHWGSYPHERDALFRFLGAKKIRGVVLVGGDIHRSRVVRHAAADRAGVDLIELITSPMHGGIIASANAPHPGLLWDAGAPQSYLLLEAEQRGGALLRCRARFRNAEGAELFVIDPITGETPPK